MIFLAFRVFAWKTALTGKHPKSDELNWEGKQQILRRICEKDLGKDFGNDLGKNSKLWNEFVKRILKRILERIWKKEKEKKEIGGLHPPAVKYAPPCVDVTWHLAFVTPNPSDYKIHSQFSLWFYIIHNSRDCFDKVVRAFAKRSTVSKNEPSVIFRLSQAQKITASIFGHPPSC